MNRRFLIAGTLAVAFTAVAATTIVRCTLPPSPQFSYSPHVRPRVFVSHHPLRAMPGQKLTIRISPDRGASSGEVTRAVAWLEGTNFQRVEHTCIENELVQAYVCEFDVPPGIGTYEYSGWLEFGSQRVAAQTSYRFQANAGLTPRLVLREPVAPFASLADSYRLEVAWVRDPLNQTENDFLTDIERSVYDGILRDPIYRWRDPQLAFSVTGNTGVTTSYYSGIDTRCGQNPWPRQDRPFPNQLNQVAVLAVLHRQTATPDVEGGPLELQFRDCAGEFVGNTSERTIHTFSVTGGIGDTPIIAKHEFGHAAFGLGDEYTESDETRRVEVPPAQVSGCCCAYEGARPGFGAGSGGAMATRSQPAPGIMLASFQPQFRRKICVSEGGAVEEGFEGLEKLPTCGATLPAECGASRIDQPACPALAGDCIVERMWGGQTLPDGVTPRPNSFTSRAECDAARIAADTHPGVEDDEQSLATCEQICGQPGTPCPCGQLEGWIVDRNPALTRMPDSMASIDARRHGGTCAWCVESSLCVRWQLALGDSPEQAWTRCNAPPEDAVAQERSWRRTLEAIGDWFLREFGIIP
jgi:hypothetical protein